MKGYGLELACGEETVVVEEEEEEAAVLLAAASLFFFDVRVLCLEDAFLMSLFAVSELLLASLLRLCIIFL